MIAGLVAFDGAPAAVSAVARMIAPPAPRGLEVSGPLAHGAAALAWCGRRRRVAVDQPAIDPSSDCAIVFDGRIDNRDEVAAWLGAAADAIQSDAHLALTAFASRGAAAIGRLAGDFAFAIWDGRQRRLVLARDALGIRQVCYTRLGARVAFATDPRQLLDLDAIDRRPNLPFFAEWMSGWITHQSDTIYRGIHRVPAGHFVTITADGACAERHWHVDPERRLRYRDATEYATQFRELFAASVRSRLRSADRVAISLSGGVDSSAITAMAATVAAGEPVELRAYHVAFTGVPHADETAYARLVADAHGLPLAMLPAVARDADAYLRAPRLLRDMPPGGVGAIDTPFYEMIAADGCALVLAGAGADEWFSGTIYHVADLLREGRIVAALRSLGEHAAHCGELNGLLTLARGPVWATCPPTVKRAIKRVLPARDIVPPIFRRDFAAAVNLAERMSEPNYDARFSSVAAGAVYRDATAPAGAYSWHEDVRAAAAFGIEMSAPFQDRALAEFALALPEEQRWSLGRAKRVLREAMRGLMPDAVRERDDKGNGSEAKFVELGRLHAAGALQPAHLAAAGIADAAAVTPLFRQMCGRRAAGDRRWEIDASQLWMLFCAEAAWRVLFSEGG
jgi:asparagine synthase (glutamine-hydrolysing)